jgi:hypothetical protein
MGNIWITPALCSGTWGILYQTPVRQSESSDMTYLNGIGNTTIEIFPQKVKAGMLKKRG